MHVRIYIQFTVLVGLCVSHYPFWDDLSPNVGFQFRNQLFFCRLSIKSMTLVTVLGYSGTDG